MIAIHDEVNDVIGNYYLVGVSPHCDPSGGVTTKLTIKLPGLLGG